MQQEKKDKTISAVSTVLIMLLCLVLCSWMGFKLPDPPIEEEGMGVAGEILGEIEGLGNNDDASFDDNSAPAKNSSSSEENYTTGEEITPVSKNPKEDNVDKKIDKKEPAKNNEDNNNSQTETKQPSTNPNATFTGRKNGKGNEGKGAAEGSGQKGDVNGTPGSQGGNGNGNGSGYSLGNRTLRGTLPVPNYTSSKDGNVTVTIKVDRKGNVITAELDAKNSKNFDQSMVKAAIDAAMKAHFNADDKALEYQYGTITYKFRRQG